MNKWLADRENELAASEYKRKLEVVEAELAEAQAKIKSQVRELEHRRDYADALRELSYAHRNLKLNYEGLERENKKLRAALKEKP